MTNHDIVQQTQQPEPAVQAEALNPYLNRRELLFRAVGLGLAASGLESLLAACGGGQQTTRTPNTASAAAQAPNPALLESSDEVIHGLGQLEQRCGRKIFSGAMQFFAVSEAPQDRTADMSWQPASLQAATQVGLQPTIILEPNFSLDHISPTVPDAYFKGLLDGGVTSTTTNGVNQVGRMVVCPEFIEGGWKGVANGDASSYVHDVNVFSDALATSFPGQKASVMIDMNTDEFRPIVQAVETSVHSAEPLQTNHIGSVGIQAFANQAPIPFDQSGKADVTGFFNPSDIKRVAAAFDTKDIWINTGLTKADNKLGVTYSTEQRVAIGTALADGVAELQKAGLHVETVNVFAQDKSQSEQRDFSFAPGDEPALINFAQKMDTLGVPISGFTAAAA